MHHVVIVVFFLQLFYELVRMRILLAQETERKQGRRRVCPGTVHCLEQALRQVVPEGEA